MNIPSAYNHLLWRQTTPGRWERDLDEAEQCYTSLERRYDGSGRIFFAITGHLALSTTITEGSSRVNTEQSVEDSLRKAWLRLRFDHPTIASWVEYNTIEGKCKKVYEGFRDGNEQDWIKSTIHVVSNGQTGVEWCNSDPPVPKLPTLYLIKAPVTQDNIVRYDLVLRAHHDIIDGVGTLHLLNNLIKHAANAYDTHSSEPPNFGEEHINLSPPFRIAASIPPEVTPEQQAKCEEIIAHNASLRENVELATVPFPFGTEVPGKHQRVAITLSKEQTTSLLQACKQFGVSITHAYHAAIAISIRDIQERKPEERSVRYINYCLINERTRCKEPYNTPAHAAAVYHSVSGTSLVVDMTVPPMNASRSDTHRKEEFRDIASHMKNHYLEIRNDTQHLPMIPYYWSIATPEYLDPLHGNPTIPKPNQTPSASISSMGVVDQIIPPTQGVFELDDPWVTGEELGTGFGLFLGTYRGCLTLSGAFNDAWHGMDEVLGFLERCNEVVWRGLDL